MILSDPNELSPPGRLEEGFAFVESLLAMEFAGSLLAHFGPRSGGREHLSARSGRATSQLHLAAADGLKAKSPLQAMALGKAHSGNTLLVAVLLLAVLSLVGATVLQTVSNRYDYSQKAVGWSEALNAAEAGADFGFAHCGWNLAGQAPWTGWKKYNSATSSWVTVTDANDANTEIAAGRRVVYDLPAGSHLVGTGEGTTDLWYHVEVDSPASFLISGNRWYRIRSTGYAGLAGMARSNNDSPDGSRTHNEMLARKYDLRLDHFIKRYGDYAHAAGTSVAVTPQTTRRVEIIAKPQTPFSRAIVASAPTGNPVSVPIVDSYDSTDTAHYAGGLYSSASRNVSTGVGVNATVYINAPISSFNATLYGSLETNGGTVTGGNNISGTVTNNVNAHHSVSNRPFMGRDSWRTGPGHYHGRNGCLAFSRLLFLGRQY